MTENRGRGPRKKTKLLYGVGVNDADYVTVKSIKVICELTGKVKQKQVWKCPFYGRWVNLLGRCYSPVIQKKQPAYIGCYVVDEWLIFSNFKSWMETQDWQGKDLDKDLLFMGNKIYGPDTCCFIDQKTNRFLIQQENKRGEWPIGVNFNQGKGQFIARCNNPFTGVRKHLGYFDDPNKAYEAWLKEKLNQAKILAEMQTDQRVAQAIIWRYENYGN